MAECCATQHALMQQPEQKKHPCLWWYRREWHYGRYMCVLTHVDAPDKRYLIGVNVATLLKKETFNLYRSLKAKGVEVLRADEESVSRFINWGIIQRGTRSVTLLELNGVTELVTYTIANDRKQPAKRLASETDFGAAEDWRDKVSTVASTKVCNESHSEQEEDAPPAWRILISMARSVQRVPVGQV